MCKVEEDLQSQISFSTKFCNSNFPIFGYTMSNNVVNVSIKTNDMHFT